MSGGIHLRGLAPGQHSSEKESEGWQAVGDTASDLIDPEIDPQTYRVYDVLNHYPFDKQNKKTAVI